MRGFRAPWSPLRAAIAGGLTGGAFDMTYALIFFGFRHVAAIRVPQSIASGILGRRAYEGGATTALLGVLLHFGIAYTMATVYVLAGRSFPALLRRPVPFGIAYGIALYAVMNYVVLPLSAVYPTPHFNPVVFWSGLAVHMFLIGLPMARFASHTLRRA
jgi:uncharacterized membrane protein YagU involved in acid resistance